jgi:hypothetical protein
VGDGVSVWFEVDQSNAFTPFGPSTGDLMLVVPPHAMRAVLARLA